MKLSSEEQQALKELIEKTERVYRNFQTSYDVEIPKPVESPCDSRMHRIEMLWHQMRKEADQIQTELVQSKIEGSEEEAFNRIFHS